jgi:multidrug efflux pump subunit AcrA (membrane-fusion protein)
LHFTEGQGPGGQPAIWDDGVYRPASNRPRLIPASGPLELALDRLKAEAEAAAARAEAEAAEARAAAAAEAEAEAEAVEARAAAEQRSSLLPGEVKTIEQLFPNPKKYRGGMIPMGRPGRFGPAAAAETLSAEQSWDIYKKLLDETKAIDPHYANAPAHPKSAFIHLPLAERQDLSTTRFWIVRRPIIRSAAIQNFSKLRP